MRHDQARCTGCSTIVTLPSMKTRSAQCGECLRKRSVALNEARPVAKAEPVVFRDCEWSGSWRWAPLRLAGVVPPSGGIKSIQGPPGGPKREPEIEWEESQFYLNSHLARFDWGSMWFDDANQTWEAQDTRGRIIQRGSGDRASAEAFARWHGG